MDYRKCNYFSNLSMLSFLLLHRQICSGLDVITHPLLIHIVKGYRLLVDELSRWVEKPVKLDVSGCNKERLGCYITCRWATKSLVRYNDSSHGDIVSQLYDAFDESPTALYGRRLNALLDGAWKIASSIPMDKLKEIAMDDRVGAFLKSCEDYRQCRHAVNQNRNARKNPSALTARRNCRAAYKCMIELVESYAREGDEGCKKFLTWQKSL